MEKKIVDVPEMRALGDMLKVGIPDGWKFVLLVVEEKERYGVNYCITDEKHSTLIKDLERACHNAKAGIETLRA